MSNFSLVLLDQLSQRVSGGAKDLVVTMGLYPPSQPDNLIYIQGIVDAGPGLAVVVWNGTKASPADNSLLYQLNVTTLRSQQVRNAESYGNTRKPSIQSSDTNVRDIRDKVCGVIQYVTGF